MEPDSENQELLERQRFSEVVRTARTRRNLSQDKFGALLGVSSGTILKWEGSEVECVSRVSPSEVSIRHWEKLADLLGKSLQDLRASVAGSSPPSEPSANPIDDLLEVNRDLLWRISFSRDHEEVRNLSEAYRNNLESIVLLQSLNTLTE